MEKLVLYGSPISPWFRQTESLLISNNVDYERKIVHVLKSEQKSDWYRKEVNSQGKVPVLVDGNFKISESLAMQKYICRTRDIAGNWYPQKDPKVCADIDSFLNWAPVSLNHPISTLLCNDFFGPLIGQEKDEKISIEFRPKIEKALEEFGKTWISQRYINGNTPTLSDLYAGVIVEQVESCLKIDLAKYPTIKEWYELLKTEEAGFAAVHKDFVKFFGHFSEKMAAKMKQKKKSDS